MSKQRDNLIADLVADLEPVEKPGRIAGTAVLWLAIAIAYSSIIIMATGPIRAGVFANLVNYPLFAIETLVSILCIIALGFATLRLSIPGAHRPLEALALPLAAGLAWLAFYVIGLWEPVHPVSMLGKRDHCVWQAVLFSVPSMGLLLLFARRLLPLWPRTTAALAGAAASAIPAAWMQLACMYVPDHIITHHLGPVLLMAIIGAAVGRYVLTKRFSVPRKRSDSVH